MKKRCDQERETLVEQEGSLGKGVDVKKNEIHLVEQNDSWFMIEIQRAGKVRCLGLGSCLTFICDFLYSCVLLLIFLN